MHFGFDKSQMYIIVCILFRNFYKKEKINSQLLVQKTILLYIFLLTGLQLFLGYCI